MKYYTLIGSRETPEKICESLRDYAYRLKQLGYIGRSGGADGADQCLEDGCSQSGVLENCNIYLPWQGFNQKYDHNRGYIDTRKLNNYYKAKKIVSKIHFGWDVLKHGARALHTRNVYQVLGTDLNTPSDFVLCYAKPAGIRGYVQGGTATAVSLAIEHGITVYNMIYESDIELFEKMLNGLENTCE